MKSSTQHSFAIAPQVNIPRSSFKRNMTYKTTFNAGYLVPVYVDEVLPGDTFNLKLTSFARVLSPLKYPIMDNLYMDFQAFFVPIRLVYDSYEKFFGSSKGASGNWEYDDSWLMPQISGGASGFAVGSLFDYMGVPTGVDNLKVNALPFRAYNRIIADWYLPSTYELASPTCNTGDTDDSLSDYSLCKRLKRPDYFTAGLIAPQRGDGVELPLGTSAPVVGTGKTLGLYGTYYLPTAGGYVDRTYALGVKSDSAGNSLGLVDRANGMVFNVGDSIDSGYNPDGFQTNTLLKDKTGVGLTTTASQSGVIADLSSATAVTINSMRQAFQLQRALERDMRGGVRYVSQLLAHFGVKSPDARLQRTEFLGSGSTPINIHTVANTNGASNFQGSLSAFATSGQSKFGFVKSFVEHGYVLILASVRADINYQQGLPKMFDRRARFDFYYPVFANIGEQVIKNKEIYAQGPNIQDSNGNVVDEQPFAYQERFAEYRYGVSKITGQLRSTYSESLDSWHLAQKFNSLPTMNSTFLEENVPMSRVKAVTSAPDFIYDSLIELNCVRPMPLYGVPGLVDHG